MPSPRHEARPRVPFIDIPAQNRGLGEELRAAVTKVIEQGQLILGPAVERFESEFAAYVGVKHCVGVNSGTSALHLALAAADIGPGDEVITTPLTWISTSWAISYVGARPVFVDIDPRTGLIDPAAIERAITPRTKAVLPVHLYGRMCDMAALEAIAERHSLVLIEDAAQAHGARRNGRRAGGFGLAGCFSFYPGKNLGALGEAGAVLTNDAALAARVRRLRDHAQATRHHHVEIGFNYRMEGIQGAALSVKLSRLDAWNQRRRELAADYGELLKGAAGFELPLPAQDDHVWHLFVVRLNPVDRRRLMAALADRGVASAVHYPTLVPHQPAYSSRNPCREEFPHAEALAAGCLSLPLFPEMTVDQLAYAAYSLQTLLENAPPAARSGDGANDGRPRISEGA